MAKQAARHGSARIGLYPGTFDPVTNGHLDVIGRAARLLDKLVVGVAINTGKGPLFTLEERVELVRAEIDGDRQPQRHGDRGGPVRYLAGRFRPQGRRLDDRARPARGVRFRQ